MAAREVQKPAARRAAWHVTKRKALGGAPADAAIDRLIHEPLRLRIMSALAVSESVTFADLRRLLDATDGNLSVHARKLEEAGYVRCTKEFAGRVPKTTYSILPPGRAAFEDYLAHMEAILRAARSGP
jgi:DNA-binding transcriptional ArsR family regulator